MGKERRGKKKKEGKTSGRLVSTQPDRPAMWMGSDLVPLIEAGVQN